MSATPRTRTETDVLIVGAGPTGLVAAIDLARRGVAVRIIEKSAAPFAGSRGKGLQPRSQEVFDDLGVLAELQAVGAPCPKVQLQAGPIPLFRGRMAKISEPTDDVPYPNLLLVAQNRTEEILRARLAADLEGNGGVQVEFGAELTGLEQDDSGVTAVVGGEPIRARYLIGADGGGSFVRKAIGVVFEGETKDSERMIVGDVRLEGLGTKLWRVFINPLKGKVVAGFCPLPGGELFQLTVPIGPGEQPDLTLEGLQARMPRSVRLTDVAWASVWRANVRMVDRFRVGRVFLAGDAAHVHPPTGGQGLNTGVQDAYNLAWKLALVLGGAPGALLDTYQEERLPVAAAVLGLATEIWDKARDGSKAKAFKRGAETNQLGIHYRGSALSSGGGSAGDRAADSFVRLDEQAQWSATEESARGAREETKHDHSRSAVRQKAPVLGCARAEPLRVRQSARADGSVRLFDLYRGPHWTLLTSEDQPPDLGPDVSMYRLGSMPYSSRYALIRPDGYVALTTDDAESVTSYLARWTGLRAKV